MVDTQPVGPLWDAIQLALQGVPEEEFIAKAKEAKEDITDRFYDLWHETTILDNLVARIAPAADWVAGVIERPAEATSNRPPTTPPAKTPSTRQRKILEFADAFTADGGGIVLSSEIAEQLSNDGFPGSERDLAVSVGNVLNRSGWKRIEPGRYQKGIS